MSTYAPTPRCARCLDVGTILLPRPVVERQIPALYTGTRTVSYRPHGKQRVVCPDCAPGRVEALTLPGVAKRITIQIQARQHGKTESLRRMAEAAGKLGETIKLAGESFAHAERSMKGLHDAFPPPPGPETKCELCQGEGEIDESLGGESFHGLAECPDCGGDGFVEDSEHATLCDGCDGALCCYKEPLCQWASLDDEANASGSQGLAGIAVELNGGWSGFMASMPEDELRTWIRRRLEANLLREIEKRSPKPDAPTREPDLSERWFPTTLPSCSHRSYMLPSAARYIGARVVELDQGRWSYEALGDIGYRDSPVKAMAAAEAVLRPVSDNPDTVTTARREVARLLVAHPELKEAGWSVCWERTPARMNLVASFGNYAGITLWDSSAVLWADGGRVGSIRKKPGQSYHDLMRQAQEALRREIGP